MEIHKSRGASLNDYNVDVQKKPFFTLDGIGRIFGCIDREMDSSSALYSYGPLLSNAPSLATIRAVHAMIQHARSARKPDVLKVKMMLDSQLLQESTQ